MKNFPGLHAAQAAVATILTAGTFLAVPGVSLAEGVPAIAPIPSFLDKALPPKPSWKEERMVRAEALYLEGYKLYQAGDRDGARKQFDQALDLVLNNLSEPVNRSSFDKRFEELVQKIYRIDVDSLQSDTSPESQPSYDKAPIDDILSL